MIVKFTKENLKKLWKPREDSSGEENGQVVIIGGSELFWGAPLLSLVAASRMVDMVFLATPSEQKEAAENTALFSRLKSVMWVPREDIDKYIEKADAVLIGPGLMRYGSEMQNVKCKMENEGLDDAGKETRDLTEKLLKKWPGKKWVIDGGSLQVMDPAWIPEKAIITPNMKEYAILSSRLERRDPSASLGMTIEEMACLLKCVVVSKGSTGYVTDGEMTYEITGGNAGLTKGGTGDVLAGLTVGFLAKNQPLLAATAASFVVKKTAEVLYQEVGYSFSSDDLAERVFRVMKDMTFGI
jgi:hydroxyethylthiazole kinase-like uncharacterized protein yjeF